MQLDPGARLGPYEVVERVGAGGMGEVYRARDTRLPRNVAIKVLRAELTGDSTLRMRLEREARSLAALNHPHICTLHDIGHENGRDYLVFEFCEGQTLAERIDRGALPIGQVLRFGIEIADALSRAHRAGIIHRDLKPSNVMLTKSGVKLLDFGLAAQRPADEMAGENRETTPLHQPITEQGGVTGTLQYLAPEVIVGKTANARSDIFALGIVLYEMLTGRRAFPGESRAGVMAAILEREPRSIRELRPETLPALEHVILKCLSKDPDVRWESAHDVAEQLRWIAEGGGTLAPRPKWARVAVGAAIIASAIAGYAICKMSRGDDSSAVVRLSIPVPETETGADDEPAQIGSTAWAPDVAISADGKRIAFCVLTGSYSQQIYLRQLDSFETVLLPATKNGAMPFFSPNGEWMAFWLAGTLRKIPVRGGEAQILSNGPLTTRGGTWGADGYIYFVSRAGLWRVPENGGSTTRLTKADAAAGERAHVLPRMLPDGKHLLFTIATDRITSYGDAKIAVLSLDSGKWRVVLEGGSSAQYVSGQLIFGRRGALYAAPFDLDSLSVTGPSRKVLDGVSTSSSNGAVDYGVASNGDLAYIPGPVYDAEDAHTEIAAVDWSGKSRTLAILNFRAQTPRMSPDGTKVAMGTLKANGDISVYDTQSGSSTRVSTESGYECCPVWTPDGSRIIYPADSPNRIMIRRADGTGDAEVLVHDATMSQVSCSPDGNMIAYSDWDPARQTDLWLLPLHSTRTPRPLLQTPSRELDPEFSPDGKWIAYASFEADGGPPQIFVRSTLPGDGRLQVSVDGGDNARWAKDGRALFFRKGSSFYAAGIRSSGNGLRADKPRRLFTLPDRRGFDVTKDGFLTLGSVPVYSPHRNVHVIVNWKRELESGSR